MIKGVFASKAGTAAWILTIMLGLGACSDQKTGPQQGASEAGSKGASPVTSSDEVLLLDGCEIRSTDGELLKVFPGHYCVYPGGDDVIAALDDRLVRMDKNGRIKWEKDIVVHHDLNITPQGTLALLSEHYVDYHGRSVRFDVVYNLTMDGEIILRWDTYEHLKDIQPFHSPHPLLDKVPPKGPDVPYIVPRPALLFQDPYYLEDMTDEVAQRLAPFAPTNPLLSNETVPPQESRRGGREGRGGDREGLGRASDGRGRVRDGLKGPDGRRGGPEGLGKGGDGPEGGPHRLRRGPGGRGRDHDGLGKGPNGSGVRSDGLVEGSEGRGGDPDARKIRTQDRDEMLEWTNRPDYKDEYYHVNQVQELGENPVQEKIPAFKPGNFLLSFCNFSMLAILDAETQKIVWTYKLPGYYPGQHTPHLLPDGNIVMLINNNRSKNILYSSIVELDPVTGTFVWQCVGHPLEAFHSLLHGSVQKLPNGNYLVAMAPRPGDYQFYEFTRNKKIVWRWSWPPGPWEGRVLKILFSIRKVPAGPLKEMLAPF